MNARRASGHVLAYYRAGMSFGVALMQVLDNATIQRQTVGVPSGATFGRHAGAHPGLFIGCHPSGDAGFNSRCRSSSMRPSSPKGPATNKSRSPLSTMVRAAEFASQGAHRRGLVPLPQESTDATASGPRGADEGECFSPALRPSQRYVNAAGASRTACPVDESRGKQAGRKDLGRAADLRPNKSKVSGVSPGLDRRDAVIAPTKAVAEKPRGGGMTSRLKRVQKKLKQALRPISGKPLYRRPARFGRRP
jgi:hypothetical protein